MATDRTFNENEKNRLRSVGYELRDTGGGVLSWSLAIPSINREIMLNDELSDDILAGIYEYEHPEPKTQLTIEDTVEAVEWAEEMSWVYSRAAF